jgi:hypothetical protein
VWTKAATYLQKAAERAGERAAYQQVVGHLGRALVALKRLPRERTSLEQFVDVKLSLRTYTMTLGGTTDALGSRR